jgi:hypothetical protein
MTNCTSAYTFTASPRQPVCPHVQTTSGFPSVASQCGLQYFESLLAVQLQAGFAHLSFAIYSSGDFLVWFGEFATHFQAASGDYDAHAV